MFCHNFAFERREYEQGLEPPVVLRGALKAPHDLFWEFL